MTNEVTPDAPTICTLTGQDMTWNGQRWAHTEPHNFCAIHDTLGESPLGEPQARLVGFGEYTIRELQERSHQQSRDKGFHDYQPASEREATSLNAERIALIHSELSEALEELRKGGDTSTNYYPVHAMGCASLSYGLDHYQADPPPACTCIPKPEGVPSELADVVIRVMDYCGANKIDLQAAIIEKLDYNATRAKMHGGKKF